MPNSQAQLKPDFADAAQQMVISKLADIQAIHAFYSRIQTQFPLFLKERTIADFAGQSVFTAQKHGQIVGMNMVKIVDAKEADYATRHLYDLDSCAPDAKVALIDACAVSPDYQGNGIGKKLVDAALAYAKSKGCTAVRTRVEENAIASARAFEKGGLSQVREGYPETLVSQRTTRKMGVLGLNL